MNCKLALKVAAFIVPALSLAGGAPAVMAKGVTITMWHIVVDSPALLDLYKKYEEVSGNTLNLVDMPADGFENANLTRWATGERPDVLEYHGSSSFLLPLNPMENMRDLTAEPHVAANPDLYKSIASYDGVVYGAAVGFPQVFGIYYNKDVLAKAGLNPPKTYPELAQLCKDLKDKAPGVVPIFEAGGSGWPQQILNLIYPADSNVGDAYSKSIVNRSVAVNDPNGPFVAAMTTYTALRDDGCFNADATTAKVEDSIAALVEGKAAIVAQHSDILSLLDAAAGDDSAKVDATIGFTGISATAPIASITASPLGTYYLPKTGDAAREEAALEFVHFVTGAGYPDFAKASGMPAVIPGVESAPLRPLMQSIKAAYDAGASIAMNVNTPGFNTFDATASQLLAGQLSPQAAADQMALKVEQAAKAAGLAGW